MVDTSKCKRIFDTNFGVRLFAQRDFTIGETVLREAPLVTGTKWTSNCVGCGKELCLEQGEGRLSGHGDEVEDPEPCSGCGRAHFCSAECAFEHEEECHSFECCFWSAHGDTPVTPDECLLIRTLGLQDDDHIRKFLTQESHLRELVPSLCLTHRKTDGGNDGITKKRRRSSTPSPTSCTTSTMQEQDGGARRDGLATSSQPREEDLVDYFSNFVVKGLNEAGLASDVMAKWRRPLATQMIVAANEQETLEQSPRSSSDASSDASTAEPLSPDVDEDLEVGEGQVLNAGARSCKVEEEHVVDAKLSSVGREIDAEGEQLKLLDVVANVWARLHINHFAIGSHEIVVGGKAMKRSRTNKDVGGLGGVFVDMALLEHSCQPNCTRVFVDHGAAEVRAIERIRKGDFLSHCYVPCTWPTTERADRLRDGKCIARCACAKCNKMYSVCKKVKSQRERDETKKGKAALRSDFLDFMVQDMCYAAKAQEHAKEVRSLHERLRDVEARLAVLKAGGTSTSASPTATSPSEQILVEPGNAEELKDNYKNELQDVLREVWRCAEFEKKMRSVLELQLPELQATSRGAEVCASLPELVVTLFAVRAKLFMLQGAEQMESGAPILKMATSCMSACRFASAALSLSDLPTAHLARAELREIRRDAASFLRQLILMLSDSLFDLDIAADEDPVVTLLMINLSFLPALRPGDDEDPDLAKYFIGKKEQRSCSRTSFDASPSYWFRKAWEDCREEQETMVPDDAASSAAGQQNATENAWTQRSDSTFVSAAEVARLHLVPERQRVCILLENLIQADSNFVRAVYRIHEIATPAEEQDDSSSCSSSSSDEDNQVVWH
ncbi:unnamed protein product [Amoebophrya sp. A25]|nr:unnamed protein product [Amoebophrya sp. A25]|eukprot:GSA25T00011245001.1